MINLVERKKMFAQEDFINEFISKFQELILSHDDYDMFDDDEERMDYFKMYDHINVKILDKYEIYCSKAIEHSNIKENDSINFIETLTRQLKCSEFYLCTVLKVDLLHGRYNKIKPVKEAIHKFERITGSKKYYEAIRFNQEDIVTILEILLPIIQFTTSLDHIYIFSTENRITIYINKHCQIFVQEYILKSKRLDKIKSKLSNIDFNIK